MKLDQLALILEIVGFLLASGFVAVLKIGAIKSWADRAKLSISRASIRLMGSDITLRQIATGQGASTSDLFRKVIYFLITHQMFLIKTFFIALYSLAKIIWQKEDRRFKRRRTKLLPITISYMFTSFRVAMRYLWILIRLHLFLIPVTKVATYISGKLTGHEAITNLFIVIGTLILFIGLVLELVASYQ